MATRSRHQSTAPSTATAASRNSSNTLPPYEPPAFSITPNAQRALAQLMQTHSLKKLDEHFTEAQAAVLNSAADINDRVTEGEKTSRKRKAREQEDREDNADDGVAERQLDELKDKVDRMTQRMEESMRKLIDGRHSVQSIKESVGSTAEFARVNASTQASTQARTQTRRRRPTEDGEEGDDEDDDYQDFEPTDPAAGTQTQPSTVERFKKDLDTAKTRYQSFSLQQRYAENNDYKDFKRLVHDARHQNDDVPVPSASTWFPAEGERPAPGVTTRGARAEAEEDDSDDDIAVSRATVSTKCPLTLQEFKSPLTSTKCPHSFESEAILQMIAQSRPVPVNGGRPEKAVQCPVSGCSKMLTKNDLQTDNVLIRKIRRLQEAARLEEEEDSEDEGGVPGTQRGATLIEDDDEDGADVDDIVEGRVKGTQVKGEPAGTGRSVDGPRAGGGVVDLAGESSDDEAEESDEDEDVDG